MEDNNNYILDFIMMSLILLTIIITCLKLRDRENYYIDYQEQWN